ncbi:MAG: hypothetical protein VYE22_19620 [Myxococcota bacterium]|nr:hypothetical protein [Myxococcota bacterium]
MNFFGHAVAALWEHDDPRWILGAMLPDFASMCGTRFDRAGDPMVAEGVQHHHEADLVFHGLPTFLTWCNGGADVLEGRGVGRGAARAVAHVGTELLLDGVLLDRFPEAREPYLEAVALPTEGLDLRFHGGGEPFERLQARLREHGLPDGYRDPAEVARRLERILSRRPRLAIQPDELPRVTAWLTQTQAELEERTGTLCDELRRGLDAVDTVRQRRAILGSEDVSFAHGSSPRETASTRPLTDPESV